jgi:FkbM family methyltransferase
MTDLPDANEFGGLAPGVLDRSVIALTSRMPNNWLGLRLAILLRRISTMRLEHPAGALDVERWGMRLRLHPIDNGCEKNLLFPPQMYETTELAALSREIDAARARERGFVFVDIGANVGLFSMFVAAAADKGAKIVAVEPESGNFERLLFNIQSNPGVPIRAIRAALSDEPGELVVERLGKDRGGTRARLANISTERDAQRVQVQTLFQLLQNERADWVDAVKIDVEGSEDLILVPFFRDAPRSLWPKLLVIEDAGGAWSIDLFSHLTATGYAIAARSKQNVIFRLKSTPS